LEVNDVLGFKNILTAMANDKHLQKLKESKKIVFPYLFLGHYELGVL
jgi:hypothetical protein